MSDFHIVVIFNDYYTLIVAFLTKQIQNRYRNRRVATPPHSYLIVYFDNLYVGMSRFQKNIHNSELYVIYNIRWLPPRFRRDTNPNYFIIITTRKLCKSKSKVFMRRNIHLQEHFPLAFDETFNSCYQLRKKSNIIDIRLRRLYLWLKSGSIRSSSWPISTD